LQNAAESFGENDRRNQSWQIQLNNAQADLNGMEAGAERTAAANDLLGKSVVDMASAAGF